MIASYKFIQKFWSLSEQLKEITHSQIVEENIEIEIFTNRMINKINQALEKFRYNIIIATYHEIYSFFKKIVDLNKNHKNLKNNFEKILIIMMPVMPHLVSECLNELNYKKILMWPSINEDYLEDKEVEIVIQVNGKKRKSIIVEKDIGEDNITQKIKNEKLIDKYLNSGKLVKTIYVKNRLINYIIKQ